MPTDNIDSVSIKRHTPLLTMTMVQEDLDNGSKELYNKRLGELPADINEFSYSIEKHEIQSIFPFKESVSDLVQKSESEVSFYNTMLEIRAQEKSSDERFETFTSSLNDWATAPEPSQELLEKLKNELKESYTYLLTDKSKFSSTYASELSEEITNLELYLLKRWIIKTKFNDDKYITSNNCTLLKNSYTSNKDLIYINRTRKIGELLQLIGSYELKVLSKNDRPQLYNVPTGSRPDNQQYSVWNGLQVFDLDLKNSPDFNSITDFEELKTKMFTALKHYKWLVCIGLSSSGKGMHIYTKVSKPHLMTLDNKTNERMSCFYYRMSYLQKYAAIRYVLTQVCGIRESDIVNKKVIDFSLAKLSHGIKVSYDPNLLINTKFEDLHPMVGYHIPPVEGLALEDWLLTKSIQNEKTFMNWQIQFNEWANPTEQKIENKSLDFVINEESIKNIHPYTGDIFYQLRYHVCNTLADMFGESGRSIAHHVLRSDDCRNRNEIDGIYNCSVTTNKSATKYGISILKKCGLEVHFSDECKANLEDDFKQNVEALIKKASETSDSFTYDYKRTLEPNEYLGHFKDEILEHIENGKANLLIAPPGTGKTEFIKALAKNKRVLLVLPYISVIDSKIVNDKSIYEYFDVYQGSTSVDGIRKGRSAVMTIDKFSNLTPEKIAYMFDIIAIDESHLLFTSSFRIEAMSNALKNIKEFINLSQFDEYSARIMCMTGTPTGEQIYFKYYNILNTIYIAKKENRTKALTFVLCKNDDEKIAKIAFHIAKSIKAGKRVLYPTNAGDVQAIKLIGMIEFELGRKVKWGYYKKSNANSEMAQSINNDASIKDYEVVLASNYLSVGIDINDITDFECVYDDSFAGYEIEQFNCRLRKVDINSRIYIGLNNNSDEPKSHLLNFTQFSIKMNREDRNLVRDFVDISNKKMELSMVYDPITNRIYTPGFRIENGQIVFKLEEHELTMFEERYTDTMRSPYFIAKEMSGYGYEINIEAETPMIQDHIETLIEVGLENARIESEIRNENCIKITNWLFDNDEYHTSVGGKIDDMVSRIWKDGVQVEEDVSLKEPEVVETYLGEIEKIKVPNRRIFDEQIRVVSRLLGVYSVETSKYIFSNCISENGKINKAEVNRYLKLLGIIRAEDRGQLGAEIKEVVYSVHDWVEKFENDPELSVDSVTYQNLIDTFTQQYLNTLGLNLRTTKMLEKYRSEVVELVNTLCYKKRINKGVRLSYRILPTPDSKYMSKIEEYDSIIVKIFQLSDQQIPSDIRRTIRLSHIESDMRKAANNVQEVLTGNKEVLEDIELI